MRLAISLNKKHAVVLGDHRAGRSHVQRAIGRIRKILWIFHGRAWSYRWSRCLVEYLSGIWHANSLILHVGMIWGRDRVGHIS
jgi:hypothetical protein